MDSHFIPRPRTGERKNVWCTKDANCCNCILCFSSRKHNRLRPLTNRHSTCFVSEFFLEVVSALLLCTLPWTWQSITVLILVPTTFIFFISRFLIATFSKFIRVNQNQMESYLVSCSPCLLILWFTYYCRYCIYFCTLATRYLLSHWGWSSIRLYSGFLLSMSQLYFKVAQETRTVTGRQYDMTQISVTWLTRISRKELVNKKKVPVHSDTQQ